MTPRKANNDGKMGAERLMLHLGCFDRSIKGWINTDITPHLWIARVPGLPTLLYRLGKISQGRLEQHRGGVFRNVLCLDVVKPFPYADNSFDAVFSSHLLEHLYPDQAKRCIEEMWRILKPGGICRIVVPDFDQIVATYDPERPDLSFKRIFECDRNPKNGHHWHYNSKSLLRLLKAQNFREAYQCAYRQGRCPDVELLDNRPDESLFVEAMK